jgi:Tfp pilus assembly protein FimT
MRQTRPKGFTLLEITVILVLLAVAAAVVAPVFRRDPSPNDDLRTLVAGARELAVRRSQSLVLRVDERGAWRLTPAGDTTSLGVGTIDPASRAIRIRVTQLGACFNEGPAAAVDWDAIACARTSSGSRTP